MDNLQLTIQRRNLVHRRTKIVATLGPTSTKPATLDALIQAGVDVFRINFSHGTHDTHAETFRLIREAVARAARPVAVLADLCGPKIRVGRFPGGPIFLNNGEKIIVTVRPVPGEPGLVPSEYPALARDVKPGDRILLADGTRELRVEAIEDTEITCTVITGGSLSDRKGMNLPGVDISTPALTEKDREDAAFAAKLGVDFMALSFVRTADDLHQLRTLLTGLGHHIPIIAKIEKPEALEQIGAILAASDGIMVARGDLGVEMAAEEVPLIQQELVRMAIEANRPVIVATQMLESMIESPSPTRAEVTDVAWAAMAGSDAVMLSGETAVGSYPVEAVATMNRVLRLVEGHQWHTDLFEHLVKHANPATAQDGIDLQLNEALARATAQLSRELSVRAIAVRADTGFTARMISAERPAAPILAFSAHERVCAQLNLYWGVTPRWVRPEEAAEIDTCVAQLTRQLKMLPEGDDRHFVLVVARAQGEADLTPSLRILLA